MEYRKCKTCHIEKATTEFYTYSYRFGSCKKCTNSKRQKSNSETAKRRQYRINLAEKGLDICRCCNEVKSKAKFKQSKTDHICLNCLAEKARKDRTTERHKHNHKLRQRRIVEKIGVDYLKQLLRRKGFSGEILKNETILQIQKMMVVTKRKLKQWIEN